VAFTVFGGVVTPFVVIIAVAIKFDDGG